MRVSKKAEPIPWPLFYRTIAALGAHRGLLIRAMILTIAVAGLSFAGPYFLKRLTDTAVAGEFELFAWLIAASFAAALVDMGVSYLKNLSVATSS